MAPHTPIPLITVDIRKKPWEQEKPFHNRWHPEIPHVAEATEGEVFRVETVDFSGGMIKDNNSAEDIKFIEGTTTHYLSGPIRIKDTKGDPAKPGDLLVVEICDLGALSGDEWGYTAIMDRENGGGFLTDHFPNATKAIWYFEGIFAYSPHIPGVRFPGLIHPGLIGTAPSKELLDIWNEREASIFHSSSELSGVCSVLHQRPFAYLPTKKGALLGTLEKGTTKWERIAAEAARTLPGRENGGNCDIKNLSKGCKVYFPVFVEGANLSTGDMHFSQGDGEIAFCGGIEMSGFLELKDLNQAVLFAHTHIALPSHERTWGTELVAAHSNKTNLILEAAYSLEGINKLISISAEPAYLLKTVKVKREVNHIPFGQLVGQPYHLISKWNLQRISGFVFNSCRFECYKIIECVF